MNNGQCVDVHIGRLFLFSCIRSKREIFGKFDYAHFTNLSYQISDIRQFHLSELFLRREFGSSIVRKKFVLAIVDVKDIKFSRLFRDYYFQRQYND